jgi:hypothetical protein
LLLTYPDASPAQHAFIAVKIYQGMAGIRRTRNDRVAVGACLQVRPKAAAGGYLLQFAIPVLNAMGAIKPVVA